MFTKTTKLIKNNYLFLLLILIGSLTKLFFASYQPLWLDEKISLYFATQFSIKNLILFFDKDVHPGLYYIFLKYSLMLSSNLLYLRFITSILPQMIGVTLLYAFREKIDFNKNALFFSIFLLIFNPFINGLSWQLRMYSISFLITIISFISFQLWKNTNKKALLFLVLFLILGNGNAYNMFILSFSYIILIVWFNLKKPFLYKVILSIFSSIALFINFILLNGHNIKSQFGDASWINIPTLINIPRVYLTLLGIGNDLNNQMSSNIFATTLFYLSFLFITLFLYKKKQKYTIEKVNRQKKEKIYEFLILSVFPSIIILFISILFPLLSQRFFFYKFIPDISLFLPRIHLPFLIIGSLYLPQIIINNTTQPINKRFVLLALITIICIWSYFNYNINILNTYSSTEKQIHLSQVISNNNVLIWPPWISYEAISNISLDDISLINKQVIKSNSLDSYLTNDNNTSSKFCNEVKGNTIYIQTKVVDDLKPNLHNLNKLLPKCCYQTSSNSYDLIEWLCE